MGFGVGRKQRFSGVLLGEWGRQKGNRVEEFRVYRSRKGKFVVHTERSPEAIWKSASGKDLDWRDWRSYLHVLGEQSWGEAPAEATLDEVRDKIPTELYDIVAAMATQPPVEDLDI
ncbi:MAG: EXLDI protein [Actinophytocola sp.]|nr:EXLDI protein [Actinophytocola sp.]